MAAEFATRGLLDRIARTVILARGSRDGRHLLDDLKLYVENGTPSRRNNHSTTTGEQLSRLP